MGSHCTHDLSQEQSKDVIALEDDNPDAIDELLKYLYTLSDHINVPDREKQPYVTDSGWPEEEKTIQVLSKEVKHLANVLIVADKYCVRDLVTLVGRKISARLSFLRQYHYITIGGKDQPTAMLLFAFSEALCFEQESPPLQEYQDAFLATMVGEFGICDVIAGVDVELTQRHPKFVCEVLRQSAKTINSARQSVRTVFAELPIAKRRKYRSLVTQD